MLKRELVRRGQVGRLGPGATDGASNDQSPNEGGRRLELKPESNVHPPLTKRTKRTALLESALKSDSRHLRFLLNTYTNKKDGYADEDVADISTSAPHSAFCPLLASTILLRSPNTSPARTRGEFQSSAVFQESRFVARATVTHHRLYGVVRRYIYRPRQRV